MPALQFFTVTKEARSMQSRDQHWLLGELCDVVGYPNYNEQGREQIRKHYFDRSISDQEKSHIEAFKQMAEQKAKEVLQPQGALQDDEAKYAVMELFTQKRRLEHGR